MKDAFKLFLFIGGRREEIISLRWDDIYELPNGIKFFMFDNLKVMRIKKKKNTPKKFAPIYADLNDFLIELGYDEKKNSNDYILFPERDQKLITLIELISKSFTHYRKESGITKNISLKNLRKTYITWVNVAMGNDTGLLTSHSTQDVIDRFYIDPKILSAIEMGALKIKVFGENLALKEKEGLGVKPNSL